MGILGWTEREGRRVSPVRSRGTQFWTVPQVRRLRENFFFAESQNNT